MKLKIFKGTSLLGIQGLYHEGRVYIPGEAMESYVGLWQGDIVFMHSPLAGKRICITVLSSGTFAKGLPADLEHFLALCTAAGAHLIYHDGGKFPAADLILAIEPGEAPTNVNYLGAAFRSRPLARKIAATLKCGLKLTYLPDPVRFNKPDYNLKLSLGAFLFTPAVAIQWPGSLNLGSWVFTSLMEHMGDGTKMEGSLFTAVPQARAQSTETASVQGAGTVSPQSQPEPAKPIKQDPVPLGPTGKRPEPFLSGKIRASETPGTTAHSASMSRALYPDFFAQLDKGRQTITKEPFT